MQAQVEMHPDQNPLAIENKEFLPFMFELGEERQDVDDRKLGCETDWLTNDVNADTD